jgi:hypothetical protein
MSMKTIEDMRHLSLNQADLAFRDGLLTVEELDLYIKHWNATSGRFTMAYYQGGAIRQKEKP